MEQEQRSCPTVLNSQLSASRKSSSSSSASYLFSIKLLSFAPINGVEGLRVADRAELVESAFDALGEAAALSDLDGNVVFWNRAAEGITGYSGDDVVGRRVRDVLELMVVGGSS